MHVTYIENYTFLKYLSLEKISFCSEVVSIGEYAFYECENLKEIKIPPSVIEIGNYAFYGCKALELISIPSSVILIGTNTFYKCPLLPQSSIPQTLKQNSSYMDKLIALKQKQGMNFKTPIELINAFKELHGTNIDFHSLCIKVHDISIQNGCPFVSMSTGASRKTQIFACEHYKKFYYDSDSKKFLLDEMDNVHTHHIGQTYLQTKSRNTLNTTQKDNIIELTKKGLTVCRIRLNECLSCSPYVMYNVRRNVIKEMRINEMMLMKEEMTHWENWTHIIYKNKEDKFCCLYSFYEPVINPFYATNVCVIDDTSCTNYFGQSLFVIITIDENLNDQVLAFSLMKKKTKNSISRFLKEFKK